MSIEHAQLTVRPGGHEADPGTDAAERVRALLDAAEALADALGDRLHTPVVLRLRAQLARLEGDEGSAGEYLQEALRRSREMDFPYMIREVERELAG